VDKKLLKQKAIKLRQQGLSYTQIQEGLGLQVPKSTLSGWCMGIVLSHEAQEKLELLRKVSNQETRTLALAANNAKRTQYLLSLDEHNFHLSKLVEEKNIAQIALAMLYLGEGSKTNKGALYFGNSNPVVIKLFMKLLRQCYPINETKFRASIQCRYDQDIQVLEVFWSDLTKIPLCQFYAARIDKRTIGNPTKKPDYKGVLRVDYFSAAVFHDILSTIKTITMGL
jgi:hypothetical protein